MSVARQRFNAVWIPDACLDACQRHH